MPLPNLKLLELLVSHVGGVEPFLSHHLLCLAAEGAEWPSPLFRDFLGRSSISVCVGLVVFHLILDPLNVEFI